MHKTILSAAEAATLLGLSKASVYEAVRLGQLPHVRIGRRILIPKTALENMLQSAAESSIERWRTSISA